MPYSIGPRVRNKLRRSRNAIRLRVGTSPNQAALRDSYDLLGRISLTQESSWKSPPTFESPVSQVCGYGQFLETPFRYWLQELKHPLVPHRKLWEYCYVLQAASIHGVIREGNSSIGFGVGSEPIPSVLAKHGMDVLATDQPVRELADSWAATGQHASALESILRSEIIDEDTFRRRVRFQPIDMLQIPANLATFDLVWSCCTIEHLGSPAAGLEFFRESLSLLNVGGIAIHTTELDLEHREASIDFGHCALYQAADIQDFLSSLDPESYEWELNLNVPLVHPEDRYISLDPYPNYLPHLKLKLHDALTTSVGIVVKKRA